jgi:hypothetical protein
MSYTPFKMRGPSLYNSPMKEDKKLGDLSHHVEEKSLDLPKIKTKEEKILEEKEQLSKAAKKGKTTTTKKTSSTKKSEDKEGRTSTQKEKDTFKKHRQKLVAVRQIKRVAKKK